MLDTKSKLLHEHFPVGTIVKIEKPFLDNKAGVIGVVYENYSFDDEHKGCSIITASGAYDGFSSDCLKNWGVMPISYCQQISNYQFKNVNQLKIDFNVGIFERCFDVHAHH